MPKLYCSLKRVSLVREGNIMDRPKIKGSEDAKIFFAEFWQSQPESDQEHFAVACLDTKHRVQSVVIVTTGTLDASLVHPREVFKPAIIEGSSAILLSHNHPSGDPNPSRQDYDVTTRLRNAGDVLGIDVLDHVIYGNGTGYTLAISETQ